MTAAEPVRLRRRSVIGIPLKLSPFRRQLAISEMGGKIHESTLGNFVREMMRWPIKVTAHGFRATFTDWGRANEYQPDWIDAQLDHLPQGKVRQAYIRDDLLPERRKMMEAYDAYASRPEPHADNVVNLRKAKA